LSELKIFLGPPGAGKGTQAKKVALEFGLAHISTGDMLRGHISNKTDLGKIAKSVMDEGKLVSDDLVIAMLVERLGSNDCKKGAILDGFPRTLLQAKSLEEIKNKFPVSKVFVFEVDEEELVQRILLRGQTSGRSDDTEESIKVRFEIYSQDTEPLIDFYNQQDKVVKINAVGDIDEINHNIAKHFN
jgi:adenylate kinase